jgi:hypothetical protein
MTTMSDYLAQMYGNQAQPQATEGVQKLAHGELFAKLAAKGGVDLTQFTPEQTMELYDRLMNKTAAPVQAEQAAEASMAPEVDVEAEKRAAAERYVAERKELAEKVASADMMGRVMARALFDEIDKIASEKNAGQMPPQFMKAKDEEKEAPSPPAKGKKEEECDEKEKAAAAFESCAIEHAVKMASDAGFDGDHVRVLCDSVRNLSLLSGESEKVAHAVTLGGDSTQNALVARGYEYLEKIGMQVDWTKVFGG